MNNREQEIESLKDEIKKLKALFYQFAKLDVNTEALNAISKITDETEKYRNFIEKVTNHVKWGVAVVFLTLIGGFYYYAGNQFPKFTEKILI